MGYKGHPGWTDGDVGNVPDKNPALDCDGCDKTERLDAITDKWAYKNVGRWEQVLLCPECHDGSEDGMV